MARRSVVFEICMEVLGDGKWYPYEWALYEVAKRVPPNLAVHRAERDRRMQWLKDHPGVPSTAVPPRTKEFTTDYLVKVGSRALARQVLTNKAFEHVRHVETKQRLIRIFPAKAPTPPPARYEHFLSNRSKFTGMTPEEVKQFRSERTRKGFETRRANKEKESDGTPLPHQR